MITFVDKKCVHISVIEVATINELKFELLPQAPYSKDINPTGYFLFPNLKKWLSGKRSGANKEVDFVA